MNKLQSDIHAWMIECFGAEVTQDIQERNHRFLEEALELVQSAGCTKEDALVLVDYVFSRPKGEPAKETGGVMVTLSALCNALRIDIDKEWDYEIDRISTAEMISRIREKWKNKPRNSPLPGKKD